MINNWGMFDASPKKGGDWGDGSSDPLEGFLHIFKSAATNLQDPQILGQLLNHAAWGNMDGVKGVKQYIGQFVDNTFNTFTVKTGQAVDEATRKQLKEQIETSLEDAVQKQQQELTAALDANLGANLTEEQKEKLRAGEYAPDQLMGLWKTIDWVGEENDPAVNDAFFDKVVEVLPLTMEEFKLYRREKACRSFRNIKAYEDLYQENKAEYRRILGDKVFVNTYLEQRSNKGNHPVQLEYTIDFDGEPLVNIKDLEDDLNSIYAEWKRLEEMDAENMRLVFD